MEGEIRDIPGERLVRRILGRVGRRPRLGMSPDFYARFGMDDPWAAPAFGGEAPADGDGLVYLSAQPYYQMMRRLAAARRRREKRLAAFAERRAGTRLRAAARSWPGESAAPMVASRLARVALDDMTLPPPVVQPSAPVEAAAAEGEAPRRAGPRGATTRVNRGASAWWSAPERSFVEAPAATPATPSVGAVDARSSVGGGARPPATPPAASSARSRGMSPAAHAGARLAAAAVGASPVARALEAALPAAAPSRARRAVARLATVLEALPPEQQAVEIRRILRRASVAPLVREVLDEVPVGRAAEVARRRAGPAPTAGLRPALSRSPAMAMAAAPELDQAAAAALADTVRADEKRGLTVAPRRAAAARRALARAGTGAEPTRALPSPLAHARAPAVVALLSASPVARAVATEAPAGSGAAPRSAVPSRAPAAAGRSATPRGLEAAEPVSPPGRAPRALPASARAVARLGPASEGAVPYLPAAPYAPAGLPASVAPAASASPSPASARALQRMDSGAADARSVVPRVVRAGPDRVLAALPEASPLDADAASASDVRSPLGRAPLARSPVRRAASAWGAPIAPVRAADGAWVAARSRAEPVAAPARPVEGPLGATRRVAARAPATSAAVEAANPAASGGVVARPSGVLHAAARAQGPSASSGPLVSTHAPTPTGPVSVARSARRAPAMSTPVLDAVRGDEGRPVDARAANPAQAAPRSTSARGGGASASASAPAASALAPVGVASASARPVPASVRAAARLDAPVLAGREAAEPPAATAPTRRHARTGPLAWALPERLSAPAADAAVEPGVASVARPVARAARGPAPRAERRPARRAYRADQVAAGALVATPGGVYMSARAASRLPGARLLRTEAGQLVALVGAAARDAGVDAPIAPLVGRAPKDATRGARFAQPFEVPPDEATDALLAPAAPPRRGATAWAAAREGVARATAYRGALRDLPADSAPATGEARRERPRRLSAASASSFSYAAPSADRPAVPGDTQRAGAPDARGAEGPGTRAPRVPLEDRLQGVASGRAAPDAPGWAARADGRPLVRSPGGLFEALARASSTEDIVRVLYARAEGVRDTPLAQEAPVVQVIEQIRQEVRREQVSSAQAASRASRLDAPEATVIRGQYVQPVASTTRVNRGVSRGVGATARSATANGADERITKLVKKLQGLIHLAEMEGRLLEAKRQVRLAEDSAGARAEGQGPVGGGSAAGAPAEKQDIEALGREVLEVVSRELELRRSRRLEDHDESVWW